MYPGALPFLDAIACFLLAAAATARAKNLGAHLTGALVLGCLCGLIGPLLREAFLHGAPASSWVAAHLPPWALAGSATGILALVAFGKWQWRVFPVLDATSIALATCAGTICAMTELGLAGGLTLGLVNGLAPGLVRDMALGDTAMLVERDWYATAAALGSVVTMAVFTLLLVAPVHAWLASHAGEAATGIGAVCAAALLLWKHPTAV